MTWRLLPALGLAAVALRTFGVLLHEEDIADLLAQAEFDREQRRQARPGALRVGIDMREPVTRAVAFDPTTRQTRLGCTTSHLADAGQTLLDALATVEAPVRAVELLVHDAPRWRLPVEAALRRRGFSGTLLFMRRDGLVDSARAFEADPSLGDVESEAASGVAARALRDRHGDTTTVVLTDLDSLELAVENSQATGISRLLVPRSAAHYAAAGVLLGHARYDVRQTLSAIVHESQERMTALEDAFEKLSGALRQAIENALGARESLIFEDSADMRALGSTEMFRVHLRTRELVPEEPFDLAAFFTAMKAGRELERPAPKGVQPLEAATIRRHFAGSAARPVDGPLEIVALHVGANAWLGTRLDDLTFPGSADVVIPSGWNSRVLYDGTLELCRN